MAQVALPDGTVIPVPDEVLGLKPAAPAASAPLSVAEDIGTRAVPRAGIRGLSALSDLGISLVKGAGSLPPYKSPIPGVNVPEASLGPTAQAIRDYMARIKTPSTSLLEAAQIKPPETGPGRYAEEAGAGAIGALTFPGGSLVPKIVSGGAAGATGEAAANLLEDKPWARIVGALLGGASAYPALQGGKLITSLAGAPSVRTPEVVSEAAKGITPAEFDAMKAGQEAGRSFGVETTPIQNLARPTPLHALQEKITPSSPELSSMLSKQNPQSELAARRFLGDIAPSEEPSVVASRAQGAAEAAIEKSRQFATHATAPDYKIVAGAVPLETARGAAKNAQQIVQESPAAREFLESEVFSKINPKVSAPGRPVSGTTPTPPEGIQSVEELKNVINEAKTKLNAPTIADRGIDRHVAGKISGALDELEGVVSKASANRPQGHALYAEIYDRIVNPMRQSLTGKIAGVKGVIEEAVPPTTRILGELNAPTVRAESIRKLATDMARGGDAQAFPALVRATWEQNLEKAFGGAEGSAANAPAKFAAALRGTAEQTAKRENFRAAMSEIARANGLKGAGVDETVVGAEKFMHVMEAAGRAKGGLGGGIPASGGVVENVVLRGGAGAASGAQLRIFGPISEMLNRKAYNEIAKLLASPEGVGQLRELAKFDLSKYRLSGVSGSVAGASVGSKER